MISARTTTAEWIDRMRGVQVREVAAELGRDVAPPRGASAGAIFGCPACDAERRHTKSADKRGAVGLVQSGAGWRCFQCDASGDALDFVAYTLRGRKLAELGEAGKADVKAWCLRWLGLGGSSSTITSARPRPPPAAPIEREPDYLPEVEVRAVWDACARADEVPEVASWLASRGIDAARIADADLARVAPRRLELPPWGGFGGREGERPWRSWPSVGLQLVVPLFDREARMRSVIFRRPFQTAERWPPKSAAARADRVGLAMCCPLARHLLELGCWPEGWPEHAEQRVRVGEGETDFLTYATEAGEADATAPATICGIAGSWRLLARLPTGSVLVVQTHPDNDGARYASEILGAVRERWRAGEIKVRLPPYFELVGQRVELRTT